MELCNNWLENCLPKLINGYSEENIFNADETGLFVKCLPNKTLAFRNETCHGGKSSKERITVLVGSNMKGNEKLKLVVIGKSAKPRCFKGILTLPVEYFSNKNAWMTSDIFEKWILRLDKKFKHQCRKVIMFVDNCPAHPKSLQIRLEAIKLVFFPPNATSRLQPMDQGVIQNLKHHFRQRILKQVVIAMEHGEECKINLLEAIQKIAKTWTIDVKASTIRNCFIKANFGGHASWEEEDEIPLAQIRASIVEMYTAFNQVVVDCQDVTIEDYIRVDEDLVTTEFPSDEILASNQDEYSADDDDDEPMGNMSAKPTDLDVKSSFRTLHCMIETSKDIPDDAYILLHKLEDIYNTQKIRETVQSKIDSYLIKI